LPSETDVCVVGGGPIGLVVLDHLHRHGIDAVLLESGTTRELRAVGDRNLAVVEGDDRYEPLDAVRARTVGGTSVRWGIDVDGRGAGARLATIEPGVLLREPVLGGWPIGFEELLAAYDAVLARLGVGVRAARLRSDALGPDLARATYAFTTRRRLLERFAPASAAIVTRSTVVGVEVDTSRNPARVTGVRVRRPNGNDTLRCRRLVLAAGTLENVRHALLLREQGVPLYEDIGLGVNDHPRQLGTVTFPEGRRPFGHEGFAMHVEAGTTLQDRLEVASARSQAGEVSASFLLFPRPERPARGLRLERALRAVGEGIPKRAGHVAARLDNRAGDALDVVLRVTSPARARLIRLGLGVSWDNEWCAWSGDERFVASRSWLVRTFIEQPPDAANRVVLDGRRDADGLPLPRLVFGRPFDAIGSATVRACFDRGWAGPQGAEVRWEETAEGVTSCHLAGGLPMGEDPATSAADPHGRLHGTANLYAVGACLFPSSGHANPTFTGMALAERLGAHLVATR